jgi:excisionase family DNA binding protein
MEEKTYTTSEVAERIGVSHQTLHDWIDASRIPAPKLIKVGKNSVRLWTKTDIERARKFKGTLKRGPKPKK